MVTGNHYSCQMKALINDWRTKWRSAANNLNFPFIVHQLSAYSGSAGVPAVRWSQYGAANGPNRLPNVAVTIGTDLSDPTSPCGNVHIRNKTAVGQRMARAARALAYSESVAYRGPVVERASIDAANTIRISFDTVLEYVSIKQTSTESSFEVCLSSHECDALVGSL